VSLVFYPLSSVAGSCAENQEESPKPALNVCTHPLTPPFPLSPPLPVCVIVQQDEETEILLAYWKHHWEDQDGTGSEAAFDEAVQKVLDLPSQSVDRELLIFAKEEVRGEMAVTGSLVFCDDSLEKV
jgi:hypothetical protein